jgi:lipoprotein-releasing system ATP-binding protein
MPGPLLVTQGVRKSYLRKGATPVEVLSGVDFTVYPADRIAIVGKSGAGKSTLLHILGTLEAPSEGTVRFLGQDIFAFREKGLSAFRNRELGFVFQFHYLMLEFTALENVMMPALLAKQSRGVARKRAEGLLEKVGLSQRQHHKPNQLSGGEQQRVAIARALVMNPKLLLTDEMTGNLDPKTGKQVFDLVTSIYAEEEMAIISVTHDEVLANQYPKIYRLESGLLVQDN